MAVANRFHRCVIAVMTSKQAVMTAKSVAALVAARPE
jgi:hypothetical protein